MQLTDWLLVEVALLLISRTKISITKTSFDLLSRDQSSFRLPALGPGGLIKVSHFACIAWII
jgi:hypothetical protein